MKKNISIFLLLLLSNICISQYKYDFKVNDDTGNAYQDFPRLSVDTAGNFVIVWQDQRNINGYVHHVYLQRYNYKGDALGNNIKVNLNDRVAYLPNVAMRKDGGFVVVWRDSKYVGSYIDSSRYYIRIYNKLGIPISNYIAASDSQYFSDFYNSFPSISINKFSEIYVVMSLKANQMGSQYIYFQKFDSLGNKIGVNQIVVDDSIPLPNQECPDINIRNDNSFIIAWHDNRLHPEPDIFMQRYYSNGQKKGKNIKVNDDTYPVNHFVPRISSDSSGNYGIVWSDSRLSGGSDLDVYCQFFKENDSLLGNNFRVCSGYVWGRTNPAISKRKDGYAVIGWCDYYANGNNWCPFFSRYSNINQVIGYQHPVTNFNPFQGKNFNDIALCKDRIISVWMDNRNSNTDIFANILSFQNPDSVVAIRKENSEVPKEYKLYQNYPNPFNPSTKIRFDIPSRVVILSETKNSMITLKIFDILGREITTLVNEKLSPGNFEINFDGRNLSSGLYFYTLFANGIRIDSKRMLLIK